MTSRFTIFAFHEDFFLDFEIPECTSISRYDSISGEQLNPYRRLSAGTIQTIVGGGRPYKALIHRRIPVHAVAGLRFYPAYYEDYLKKQFPEEYFDLSAAFSSVDQSEDFPAMSKLLFEIESYRGEGMAAGLFYEAEGGGGHRPGGQRTEAPGPEPRAAPLPKRFGRTGKRR